MVVRPSKEAPRDLKSWHRLVDACLLVDQHRLRRNIKRIAVKAEDDADRIRFEQHIDRSKAKRELRAGKVPLPKYPQELPVVEQREDILKAIRENQVVILCGHTQPRRIAARTVASRIASELDSSIGESVGFKIRFSDQVTERTYIKLMTDGILLAEIQNDPWLNQYDTLIIDEAHERSLNIDTG